MDHHFVICDFTTVHRGFRFYLNSVPTYTKYDRQWWLNRLFSKDPQDNCIDVYDDTRGYSEIPGLIEKYLDVTVTIDCLKDPRKGSRIFTETQQYKDKVITIEKWKPDSDAMIEKLSYTAGRGKVSKS